MRMEEPRLFLWRGRAIFNALCNKLALFTGVQKSLESVLVPERSGNDKLLDLVSGEEGARSSPGSG